MQKRFSLKIHFSMSNSFKYESFDVIVVKKE